MQALRYIWTAAAAVSAATFAGGLAISACSSADATPAATAGACSGTYAVAALSDYKSSELATLVTPDGGSFIAGQDLGSDPALAKSNGHLYWIARDSDEIFPLDSCGRASGTAVSIRPPGTTSPVDPQDLALASDGTLWIPTFDVPAVQIRNPDGGLKTTVDLSSTTYDSDKNPEASSINIVRTSRGEEAYVALERLDDAKEYVSDQASSMLVLDVPTARVQKVITLAGRNPFGQPVVVGSHLYFAEPGNEGSAYCACDAAHEPNAGIERFDTEAQSGTLIATESELGGSVMEVAISDDGKCGVAIIADSSKDNRTSLVTFDPTVTRDPGAPVPTPLLGPTSGFDLSALAWTHANGEVLLVGDRRMQGGGYASHSYIRTSDSSCALTAGSDVYFDVPPVAFRAVSN